ncbi:MAG: hypothetical protein GXZ08_04050 [Tissierellia bacterium]|nr:hypothetical protein [Tissierellia bacterium]
MKKKVLLILCLLVVLTACSSKKMEGFSNDLKSGNYLVGRDMPEGEYSAKWINGTGKLRIIANDENLVDDIFGPEHQKTAIHEMDNIVLDADTRVLVMGDLELELTSTSLKSEEYSPVKTDDANAIELEADKEFVIGSDIPEGLYTIQVIEGNGYVSSPNFPDGGISQTMGDKDNNLYLLEYRNVELIEGANLTTSGVSVKLIPMVGI